MTQIESDPILALVSQYETTWAACPGDEDKLAEEAWSAEMKRLTQLVVATPPTTIEGVTALIRLVLRDMEHFLTDEEEGFAMLSNAYQFLNGGMAAARPALHGG